MRNTPVAVIGAGAWGTTVAQLLAVNVPDVRLWMRSADQASEMQATRINTRRLPGVTLNSRIAFTDDTATALRGAAAAFVAIPSRYLSEVLPLLPEAPALVSCIKGFGRNGLARLSDVMQAAVPNAVTAVLSGPNLAREVASGLPAAAVIASRDESFALQVQGWLQGPKFRVYTSSDVAGVEIGGAVKNVIAIACGMMTGAGHGENTRAAIITRGLDEMKSLAEALGGRRETVTGLSGAGDLTLTCSSPTSRNMSLGQQLGKGIARAHCFDGRPVVVEGEVNAKSVTDLARRLGIALPICETVRTVLQDGVPLDAAFAALWSRPIEAEPRAMDLSFDHPARSLVPLAR